MKHRKECIGNLLLTIIAMKPIEKYKQKFIELLKEVEDELGGCIKIEVSSSMRQVPSVSSCYPEPSPEYKKHYDFSLSTNENKITWF